MSWLVALLAGFQVTIIGRIWVTAEGQYVRERKLALVLKHAETFIPQGREARVD